MIKASFDIVKPAYLKLFTLMITVGQVPAIWCKGLITPVHKNGDPFDSDNYRPICVLSCLCKFFTNLLNSRLYDPFMKEKIINPVQIGFVENPRTTDHIFTLKTIISKHVSAMRQGKIYACFVDFKKAYDTVWHEGLFTKLSKVNIKGQFLTLIESLYRLAAMLCCKNLKISHRIHALWKGVRQGCPLGPILLDLYINDLLNNLHHTNPNAVKLTNDVKLACLAYADDIIIISHSALGLQASLDYLNNFCKVYGK